MIFDKLNDDIITKNLNLDKFTLCDGDGLYLIKQKATARPTFITKFRIAGKIKTKTIGFYGNISLNLARAERDKIKQNLKQPENITLAPENEPAISVLNKYQQSIFNASNTEKSRQAAALTIQRYITPFLENKNINDVKALDIKQILDSVSDKQGRAEQVLMRIKGLFKFAMINNNLTFNPSKNFTKKDIYKYIDNRSAKLGGRVLDAKNDAKNNANEYLKFLEALKFERFGNLYRKIFLLLTVLCVRKNELTEATWNEFDFDKNIWHLPAERTKTRQAIDIPLPPLAVEILLELKQKTTAKVVPNLKKSTKNNISDSTLWRVIRRVCRKHHVKPFSPHSYRKTSRTLLSVLGVSKDVAEHCLNHAIGDKIERTYNKDPYFQPRADALNKLANYIASITGY